MEVEEDDEEHKELVRGVFSHWVVLFDMRPAQDLQ